MQRDIMTSKTMRIESPMHGEASTLGLLGSLFAVFGLVALTLCASVGLAQTQPDAADSAAPTTSTVNPVTGIHREAETSAEKKAKAIPPTTGKHHPHATGELPESNDALMAKLANPSAPILSFRTFLDTTAYRGTAAPGTAVYGFDIETQPAFPFFVGPAAFIFRPTIVLEFGEPYVDSAGNVQKATGIGNWQLDTLYGKTLKNGLMVMGGLSTQFPSATKKEVRQDWGFGPEALLGYAKGNVVFGMLVSYTWQFPQVSDLKKQTVGAQYFYGVNLGNAWQLSACPTWSYDRDTRQLTFPLGLGVNKMVVFPKRNKPLLVGVELWGYPAQDDTLGPVFQLRVVIVPMAPIPWQKKVQKEMAAAASAAMRPPPRF